MKRESNKKKGVSPVVSTVMLVLIVVVIASIILLWSQGFIKERVLKFDKTVESICDQDIKIKTFVNDDFSFGFTNDGNIPIVAYDLKVGELGSSNIIRIDERVNPGYSSTIESGDVNGKDYGDFDDVKVIPVIIGKSKKSGSVKEYTCPERAGIVV
jgi:flagellin-like protein